MHPLKHSLLSLKQVKQASCSFFLEEGFPESLTTSFHVGFGNPCEVFILNGGVELGSPSKGHICTCGMEKNDDETFVSFIKK